MDRNELEKAATVLRSGGVILYPTDTGWAIGADATQPDPVQRILDIKAVPTGQGLTVLVEKDARIERHVKAVPDAAWDLIDLAQEPITIVLPDATGLAPAVCAKGGSLAVRLCKDAFCQALIARLNRPIVSAAAHTAGKSVPKSFSDIDTDVLDSVDYPVNLRRSELLNNPPSRIIKLGLDGTVEIIR